jgi:hypothetical protein
MKPSLVLTALSALACPALSAPAYLEEFGSGWESRWVKTGSEKFTGVMDVTAGEHAGDAADQAGLHTTANARHYGYVHFSQDRPLSSHCLARPPLGIDGWLSQYLLYYVCNDPFRCIFRC